MAFGIVRDFNGGLAIGIIIGFLSASVVYAVFFFMSSLSRVIG